MLRKPGRAETEPSIALHIFRFNDNTEFTWQQSLPCLLSFSLYILHLCFQNSRHEKMRWHAGYSHIAFQIHFLLFSTLLCTPAADLEDLQQRTCSVASHWGYPEKCMDKESEKRKVRACIPEMPYWCTPSGWLWPLLKGEDSW